MNKIFNHFGRCFAFAAALLTPFLATSCDDDDNKSSDDPAKVEISVNPAIQEISGEASTINIVVRTEVEVAVTTDADWLSIGTPEKVDDLLKYPIECQQNDTKAERTATITFTHAASNTRETATVTQHPYSEAQEPEEPTEPADPQDATGIIKAMGMGWNLGNNLDAHANGVSSETCWGNKACTQATMNAVKAAGFKTVRIPVTWLGHVDASNNYKIDDAWLNRVAEVVSFAENAGLFAIINIHHDGADSKHWLDIKNAATTAATNTTVKEQLTSMWTQIANKFADKGDFLIFETLNEIHDGGWGWGANRSDGGAQYATLNEWNQVAVDAIRATGGNNATRWIGVPGYVCNPDLTVENLVVPTDPAGKVLVAVHDYDPYKYTLEAEYNAWGHLATSSDKAPSENESQITSTFSKLKTTFIDKGYGVYIGEIGCVHRDNDRAEAFRKYYLEYVCKAAKTYGIAPIFWDNGSTGAGRECSGLINHSTGDFINNGKDIIDIMVNAIENTDASYTLESVYNNTKIQ